MGETTENVSTSQTHTSRGKQKAVGPAFSTQGALLLQCMLRVHEPHNQAILGRRVLYHTPHVVSENLQSLAFWSCQ